MPCENCDLYLEVCPKCGEEKVKKTDLKKLFDTLFKTNCLIHQRTTCGKATGEVFKTDKWVNEESGFNHQPTGTVFEWSYQNIHKNNCRLKFSDEHFTNPKFVLDHSQSPQLDLNWKCDLYVLQIMGVKHMCSPQNTNYLLPFKSLLMHLIEKRISNPVISDSISYTITQSDTKIDLTFVSSKTNIGYQSRLGELFSQIDQDLYYSSGNKEIYTGEELRDVLSEEIKQYKISVEDHCELFKMGDGKVFILNEELELLFELKEGKRKIKLMKEKFKLGEGETKEMEEVFGMKKG